MDRALRWLSRFIVGFLALLFVFTTPGMAATIVIDFGTPLTMTASAQVQTFLTNLKNRENTVRAARTPPDPPLTLEQYIRDVILADFQGRKVQSEGLEKGDACATFQAFTTAQQDSIISNLGGHNPCP